MCALVFHWATLKWCSHASSDFDVSAYFVDASAKPKDHCRCVHEEKQNVPALNSKSSRTEKSTKAVSCFCSFTYRDYKGEGGEGVEMCVNGGGLGEERRVAPEEKAKKREQFKV